MVWLGCGKWGGTGAQAGVVVGERDAETATREADPPPSPGPPARLPPRVPAFLHTVVGRNTKYQAPLF